MSRWTVKRIHFICIPFFSLFLCGHLIAQTVRLEVDATAATGRIFRSSIIFPAKEGPLTLFYPKWFPGTHAPTGQISDLTGLRMKANGKEIPWNRDPLDMFAFHCTVPKLVTELEVALDFVVPTDRQGDHHPSAASQYAAMISWTSLLLYPEGSKVEDLIYMPVLRLPEGWKYGTALKTARQTKTGVEFAPVSLYTLIDSPVVAGIYFRTIDLNPGSDVPFMMHLAADSEAALQIKPEIIAGFRNLFQEELALFGARHFNQYHFLVTLSDPIKGGAVEHHESSDNRPPERMFIDIDPYRYWADTLPHEMVHSWNGKYRRPAGLNTRNYQEAIHSDLLWVYEGLTNYLGYVLAARSGLLSEQEFLDATAWMAAGLDQRPGRSWKPLADTTVGAQALTDASSEWETWRRSLDYYEEGVLIWMEVDTILRQKSGGSASLDDFCRNFFGGENGPPEIKPYTREDLENTLNNILSFNWKQFFLSRIDQVTVRAPLGGVQQGGWILKYVDNPTPYHTSIQKAAKRIDLRFSVGLYLDETGTVVDVVPGTPATKGGIAPGAKILGVNGRHWSDTQMKEAVRDSKNSRAPLEFLVENGDFYKILHVDYHDGQKYPILERAANKPDLLHQILVPHRAP